MLHLQIGFPSGRYWAATHADPSRPEWPPHPSRVYSALVAGAYGVTGRITDAERNVLNRLAAADPPAIAFPDADLQAAPQSYVPVNDEASRVAPALKSHGVLMPNRQVRHFPVAYLTGEPEVRLSWSLQLDDEELALLDGIAARVTHLGTSHSLITARFSQTEEQIAPRWIPATDGRHYLRVPIAGRLDELDRQVARRADRSVRDELRRHAQACEITMSYRQAEEPPVTQVDVRHDWIALKLEEASWGADTAHTLARAARRALMALVGDDAPAALHGHDTNIEHLAWLPLPDVGHPHARGRIRGLAIGFPRSLPMTDAALLMRALQQLQRLRLPDGQVARLSPVQEGASTPVVLRADTWCRPSTTWATVTPVILDHPPRRADADRLVAALIESLEHAGLPTPVEVRLTRYSAFDGAPAAQDVPTKLPRYHAEVCFPMAVAGPVMAGRWRNFGIGLLRPIDGSGAAGGAA